MQKFFGVVQDASGNTLSSATITVNIASGGAASIFSDNAYTVQANPFTNQTDGTYQFFAANGRYDIVITKTGYTFVAADTADNVVYDPSSVITPAQITVDQNDYSPSNALNATVWRLSSDTLRNITGIGAGKSEQRIVLRNVGTADLSLTNESGSSSAANRITTGTGGALTLAPNTQRELYYDATTVRWRPSGAMGGMRSGTLPASYLTGFTLSNDSGTPNTVLDIATGSARDSTNTVDLVLGSAFTKTTGAFAAGTGNGGLFSGAVANNTWYHVFAIRRDSDNTVEVGFDTSVTAANKPAGWTYFRRIGSFKTATGTTNILTFVQDGDYFRWLASIADVSAVNPGVAAVTRTLTVPTGVNVFALVNAGLAANTGATTAAVLLSDLGANDEAATTSQQTAWATNAASTQAGGAGPVAIRTNTSAQIRSRLSFSDANVTLSITTIGWFDRRGRDV